MVSVEVGLRNLKSQGNEANADLREEGKQNAFTEGQIQKAEQENLEMYNKIKVLRDQKIDMKAGNEMILTQKNQFEREVRTMQEDTE